MASINIYNNPTNIQDVKPITGNIIVDPNVPDYVTPLDVDILKTAPQLPPIDYTNLDFGSIKLQLLNLLKANAASFGYSVRDFADSNTAGMMINLMAYMGQMMSFHTDSMVNELFLDTAQTSWSVNRLLGMYGYKPSRPRSGVILLTVTRTRSTASSISQATLEDSSQILFSSSSNRRQLILGNETFEIFPAKTVDGNLQIDPLGDFILPPLQTFGDSTLDPDFNFIENQKNTYFCFGLSGTTKIEDFKSNGLKNQVITLGSSPVNDSKVLVQVQDPSIVIPGKIGYMVWDELSYLPLAGFRTNNKLGVTVNDGSPYLIVPYKLSDAAYAQKKSGYLSPGMVLEIDYSDEASIANYQDFIGLKVTYKTGIISNLTSEFNPDDHYIDLILYHSSYVYGLTANSSLPISYSPILTNTVVSNFGEVLEWEPGEILYLAGFSSSTVVFDSITYYQPQIVSEKQLLFCNDQYSDLVYLRNHSNDRIAIGRALSKNTLAFGLSADIISTVEGDKVYEVTWDGDYVASIRFGDGTFGAIPDAGLAIKVIYRVNNSLTSGTVIPAQAANQVIQIGSVNLAITNPYASAPSTNGESVDTSKTLVSRFFSTQDRAVNAADYSILTKKYDNNIKVVAALSKADADGSTVRLFTLIRRFSPGSNSDTIEPLSLIEKYQLREYLNQYKCIGASIELIDGTIRNIDLRIDIRIKPGYLSGDIKAQVASIVNQYFNLGSIEMGQGLDASALVKAIASVSGIKSLDIYLGGLATINDSLGNEIQAGTKIYQQLKDIPGFDESTTDFPKIDNQINNIFGISDPLKAHEILVLSNLTINTR